MTVGLYQAVIKLNAVSGLPEDTCENVLHFADTVGVGDHDTVADALITLVDAFFNDVGTGAAADIASCIGEQITRDTDGCGMDLFYKETNAFPDPFGSPVETRTWTLDAATAGLNLPSECAVVASFHGFLGSIPERAPDPDDPDKFIRPASRRRGRIYLGPLTTSSGTEDGTTHELLPSSGFRNSIIGACVDLKAAMTPGQFEWVVWSRKAQTVNTVVGGYVDYAYDTQRRRGQAPVARQSWP